MTPRPFCLDADAFESRAALSRRLLIGLALFVACVLGLPADAAAQCRIEGVVRLAAGAPVAGATIRILVPNRRAPIITATDENGRYAVEDLKPGVYVEVRALIGERVIARGFTLVTMRVETLDITAAGEASGASGPELDPMGGDAGDVRGVVRTGDGTPIGDARVEIAGASRVVTTDAAGRYLFGSLRSGVSIELRASALGFKPANRSVAVPTGRAPSIDLTLQPATVEDHSPVLLAPAESAGDGSVVIRPEAVLAVPSPARGDIVRAAQFLPGVVATTEDGDLMIHAGSPGETLTTYNGFAWYPFSRLFGGSSPFNPESVREARLTGQPGADTTGGRVGGALRLETTPRTPAKPAGSVDLGMFGVAANVVLPVGANGALSIGGRRSLPASLYGRVLDSRTGVDARPVRDRVPRFSGGQFVASAPSFADANAALEFRTGTAGRLSVTALGGRDDNNFSRDVGLPEPSDSVAVPAAASVPADARFEIGDTQRWEGRGVSAVWRRHWSSLASTTLTAAYSRFSKERDQSYFLTSPSTGEDYGFLTGRGGSQALAEQNAVRDATLRFEALVRPGFQHAMTFGAERVALETTYASLAEAYRLDAASGAQSSALVPYLNRRTSASLLTGFLSDLWRPHANVSVSPGVRLSHYDRTGETYVDSRVSASYRLRPRLRLTGGWSLDHQAVNQLTREDREHGDAELWLLSDAELPLTRGQQVWGGAAYESRAVIAEARVYRRELDGVALFAPRLVSGLPLADLSRRFHVGSETATGLELRLQHSAAWNSVWTSYTRSYVEDSVRSLETYNFPASTDQLHQLTAVDTVRIRGGWSASASWVSASGRPFTPFSHVQSVWLPTGEAVYQGVFGYKNSERLPPYHRLDLSSQFVSRLGAMTSTIGATVFNVSGRANVLERNFYVIGQSSSSSDVLAMRRALDVFFRLGF